MLPARPHLPSQPCPACGRDVDPLRAERVLWLEDGVRFLCSRECRARFLRGEQASAIPIRTSSQGRMVVNLKIARTLGVTFPLDVLDRAALIAADGD